MLCLAQGSAVSTSVLFATFMLASPTTVFTSFSFSAVDLAGPVMVLATLAIIIPSPGINTDKSRLVDAMYAGLLSGFAAGSKISFAPFPVIIFLWLVFGKQREYKQSTRNLIVFIICVAAAGGYWYARNVLLTGNPLFPANIGPFKGPYIPAQQHRSMLINWVLAAPTDYKQWEFLLKGYFDWPFSLALLALIGYGVALYSSIRQKTSFEREVSSLRLLILITGLIFLIQYPITPFSGTVNWPTAPLGVFRRYLVVPFLIGMVLFSPLVDHKHPWQRLFRFLFVTVSVVTLFGYLVDNLDIRSFVAGCIILGLWKFLKTVVLSRPNRWIYGPAFLLISLIALVLWEPYAQQISDERIFNWGIDKPPCHSIGSAWRFLETLPEGTQIVCIGTAAWLYYPVFGRKFQLTPRFLYPKPLHEDWHHNSLWYRWFKKDEKNDPGSFLPSSPKSGRHSLRSRIIDSGVDYVIIGKGEYKWTSEYKKLVSFRRAQVVYDDGCSVIMKIIR
jgi:hypothetical protein